MKEDEKLSTVEKIIKVALGEAAPELVLKNCKVVNVFSGEIRENDISIIQNRIASIKPNLDSRSSEVIDCKGLYAVPGLLDGHIHLDSTLLEPRQLAKLLISKGTTCVFMDPHEIANVLGLKGIKLLLKKVRNTPLKSFLQIPSRVPTAPELETTGGVIGLKEIRKMLEWENVTSLGELDPSKIFPPKENYLRRAIAAKKAGKTRVGHAAGLSGKKLMAYRSVGMSDDHECTTVEEALERLKLGMKVMVREGTSERNLKELIKVITQHDQDARNLFFCTDDKHPGDIQEEGHINYNVQKAIREGVDPINAIQMGTINCAEHFRVDDELGSITPGKIADLVLVKDIEKMDPKIVVADGEIAVKDGKYLIEPKSSGWPEWSRSTIKMKREVTPQDFKINSREEKQKVRVIKIIEGQIINNEIEAVLSVKNGEVQTDKKKDILKIACVERHKETGNIGVGFVQGFGLKKGTIASSVAHDHHNIVAVSENNDDLAYAVNALKEMRGGFIAVRNNEIIEKLPLPVAGLLSTSKAEEVVKNLDELNKATSKLGCKLNVPYMTLSFISLPTVPELGLTDKGLVDVEQHKLISVKVQ